MYVGHCRQGFGVILRLWDALFEEHCMLILCVSKEVRLLSKLLQERVCITKNLSPKNFFYWCITLIILALFCSLLLVGDIKHTGYYNIKKKVLKIYPNMMSQKKKNQKESIRSQWSSKNQQRMTRLKAWDAQAGGNQEAVLPQETENRWWRWADVKQWLSNC